MKKKIDFKLLVSEAGLDRAARWLPQVSVGLIVSVAFFWGLDSCGQEFIDKALEVGSMNPFDRDLLSVFTYFYIALFLGLAEFIGALIDLCFAWRKLRKAADQHADAAHEPHSCSVCPVHNGCTCSFRDASDGCQGDYHCPEKVTHFEDPGAGRCS